MASQELLNEIFRFKHKRPSADQDVNTCEALVACLHTFISQIKSVHVEGFTFNHRNPHVHDRSVAVGRFAHQELDKLRWASQILQGSAKDVWIEQWFPVYGCVLQMERVKWTAIELVVIFPDGWEWDLNKLPNGDNVHFAVAPKHNVLHCGTIKMSSRERFGRALASILQSAQWRTGEKRNASANAEGHQKTPQFLANLVINACSSVEAGDQLIGECVPRGGSTDVGQHTGSSPRGTCWPLVTAVLRMNLTGTGALYEKCLVLFQICLLDEQMRVLEPVPKLIMQDESQQRHFWMLAEQVFEILEIVVLAAVDLLERGYDVSLVQARCHEVRDRLTKLIEQVNTDQVSKYILPTRDDLKLMSQVWTFPKLERPEYVDIYKDSRISTTSRSRLKDELNYCEFVDGNTCCARTLLEWLGTIDRERYHNKCVIVLRTIEDFVFKNSQKLQEDKESEYSLVDSCSPSELYEIVEMYQKYGQVWHSQPLSEKLMQTQHQSREVSVLWVSFCLVHQWCANLCEPMHHYGISLQWQRLEVLVLSERKAMLAVRNVAAYIRQWNRSGHPPIFHLSVNHQSPTIQFGRDVAHHFQKYEQYRNEEKAELHRIVAERWQSVLTKKQEASRIRSEIASTESELAHQRQILGEERARLAGSNLLRPRHSQQPTTWEINRCKRAISQFSKEISGYQKRLRSILPLPPYIPSSLPKRRDEALQTLFFLEMDPEIAILAQLCLMAQRALGPKRPQSELRNRIAGESCDKSWMDHFNKYKVTSQRFHAQILTIYPSNLFAPSRFGPSSIDEVHSAEQLERMCVWYPNCADTRFIWKDLSGRSVNPFKISNADSIDYFTEALPEQYSNLKWAVAFPGGASRGNLVYANLDDQPEQDFARSSYLTFGSLRSFPNQQIRKLCCAMRHDALPWSHPCVAVLVRQALFQIGELTDETTPHLLWKSDLVSKEGRDTFYHSIHELGSKLAYMPRKFKCIPLLSEVAGFLSQFKPEAFKIAREFAKYAREWACETKQEIGIDLSVSRIEELRVKECLLYGYGLLSYSLGPIDDEYLVEICELNILFRNAMNFLGTQKIHSELNGVRIGVSTMMTRRIVQIVSHFTIVGFDDLLTSLLLLVNIDASSRLDWKTVSDCSFRSSISTCFETHDPKRGTLYAINLFNGCILTDGHPPRNLPPDIRETEGYRQLFGLQDFEVDWINCVYRTKYKIEGWRFQFYLKNEELVVEKICEESQNASKITLQLCSSAWMKKFQTTLPIRLYDMHSLWFWMERQCVLLLPKSGLGNDVSFVVTFDEHTMAKCVQIAATDKSQAFDSIINNLDQYSAFVQTNCRQVVTALSKFESQSYIHVKRSSTGVITFELPRFSLSFSLNVSSCDLESVQYQGYALDVNQQLCGIFPRFGRYLVLRTFAVNDTSRPEIRLLIPAGTVIEIPTSKIDINIDDGVLSEIPVVVFDQHRQLKILQAESISARLQLALLYASSGTVIPDITMRMTGAEAALQTLRWCKPCQPFSNSERDLLLDICKFCYREPALRLMVAYLLEKSQRLSFLFRDVVEANEAIDCLAERDEYRKMCSKTPTRNSWRVRLNNHEERSHFGISRSQRYSICTCKSQFVDLGPVPVPESYASSVENKLLGFVAFRETKGEDVPQFPLNAGSTNIMGTEMTTGLEHSWNIHHRNTKVELNVSIGSIAHHLRWLLSDVSNKRAEMESYINTSLDQARSCSCNQLLALINYLPQLTPLDNLRISFDDNAMLEIAPRLSQEGRNKFKLAVLIVMELTVLHDKLARIVYNADKKSPPPASYFVEELRNKRTWKTEDYPYWLAFEVERHLQIRQEQYLIAKFLIDNPGAVCQLNMGRGKTRVILPMLFLYYSRQKQNKIVRAHFLSPLLSETRQFMHRSLTAGTAALSFFEQPFHRKIELGFERLELMQEALEQTKMDGGFQMISAEHRLSLELKRWQLSAHNIDEDNDSAKEILDEILDNDQYVDILDECDALLSHKYHLVYAMGLPQKLENGSDRWIAAQALLRVIVSRKSTNVIDIFSRPNVCSRNPEYKDRIGGFDGLRLSSEVEEEDNLRQKLKRALALDLIKQVPFEMSWLGSTSKRSKTLYDQIVHVISDPTQSIDELTTRVGSSLDSFKGQLLALRGLVAFGILEHCLEKRPRVDYGLPNPGTRDKLLAIPYRAADLPADRSEFSHPDVAIVLTLLAYYHAGLRDIEVKHVFESLLELDFSEQKKYYSEWYDSVKADLSSDQQAMLENVEFISLEDARILEMLCDVYRFSMEVINFYLNMRVFPRDTNQFPQRIARSAWNLTAGPCNIGFSGTKDNHMLLPLAVTQCAPESCALQGTDGEMIHRILQVFQGYKVISQDDSSSIAWRSVLLESLRLKAHALIDTGAILAGVFNHDAAKFMLDQDAFSSSGVTYYDSRPEWDCWVILERTRQSITRLKKSSILEEDTFVIFDEARSRGSDMKLLADAMAVLTLGPNMTKDKLMQGAGRMRLLGCNQTLTLMSLNEITQSILQASAKDNVDAISVVDILNWVMDNTRSEAVHGLLEWAGSGLHYNQTLANPDSELIDEDWSLNSLYEAPQNTQLICDVVLSRVSQIYGDQAHVRDIVDAISKKALQFGQDDEVLVASHDQECEREVQQEKEQHEEEVVTPKNCMTRQEMPWKYIKALSAKTATDLRDVVVLTELSDFVKKNLKPTSCSQVLWSAANIYGTYNFFTTVVAPLGCSAANEFTRNIDAMLLFHDRSILLLSECEADHILRLLWTIKGLNVSWRLLNLSYVLDAIGVYGERALAASVPRSLGAQFIQVGFPCIAAAACCLFNGQANLGNKSEQVIGKAMNQLLGRMRKREETLREFVELRGHGHAWKRSALHDLCCQMDQNDSH